MARKPTRWALDTSWLYAFLDKDDEFHEQAVAEASNPGYLLLNPVIFVELLDVVHDKADRHASLQAMREVLSLPQVRFVEPPRHAAMSRVMERHGRISWFDASAICTALDEGAGLRTFDDAQRKAFESLS